MVEARRFMAVALVGFALVVAGADASRAQSAHDFEFTAIDGAPLPMSTFKGKAVLLVNTASFCGFTPQYKGLQTLWQTYRERGLVVLGVPSNDFGGQEPKGEAAIKDFCETNFQVDFPMTAKQKVVGRDAHPLYRWIVEKMGAKAAPRWNFHKFLIGRDGQPAAVFTARHAPMSETVTAAVEAALGD